MVGSVEQGRGEFLFDQYSIDSFKVERNPECPTCGDLERAAGTVQIEFITRLTLVIATVRLLDPGSAMGSLSSFSPLRADPCDFG